MHQTGHADNVATLGIDTTLALRIAFVVQDNVFKGIRCTNGGSSTRWTWSEFFRHERSVRTRRVSWTQPTSRHWYNVAVEQARSGEREREFTLLFHDARTVDPGQSTVVVVVCRVSSVDANHAQVSFFCRRVIVIGKMTVGYPLVPRE
jgi:hypothetical protein